MLSLDPLSKEIDLLANDLFDREILLDNFLIQIELSLSVQTLQVSVVPLPARQRLRVT